MGHRDLKRMQLGEMDPRGKGNTRSGRTCAMVGVLLSILGIFFVVVLYAVVIFFVAVSPKSGPGGSPSPRSGGNTPGKVSFALKELRLHNNLPSFAIVVR
jgi:hypothetical protein